MPISPPTVNRLNPVTALLIAKAEYLEESTAKAIVTTNESSLVFGTVATATTVNLGLKYTSVSDEDFALGVGFLFTGDNGAFTLNGQALVSGAVLWGGVPPSTYASASTVAITALAANAAVAKTGTLAIVDRFDFFGNDAVTRTLKTIALSKTYSP